MAVNRFDDEALALLRDIMEDEFNDLIQVFINDSDIRLQHLNQAYSAQQFDEVRRLAHSFKGASSNVATPCLTQLCFQVEEAAHQRQIPRLVSGLRALQTEYLQVRDVLLRMIHPTP